MPFIVGARLIQEEQDETSVSHKDRRRRDQVVFIDRRKGKIWMYGEILLFVGLIMYIVWRMI